MTKFTIQLNFWYMSGSILVLIAVMFAYFFPERKAVIFSLAVPRVFPRL